MNSFVVGSKETIVINMGIWFLLKDLSVSYYHVLKITNNNH